MAVAVTVLMLYLNTLCLGRGMDRQAEINVEDAMAVFRCFSRALCDLLQL